MNKKEDPIAREIYERLATKKATMRHYLGMSQIGHACDRALWYQYREYPAKPVDGRIYALFELGAAVERLLISYLKETYHVKNQTEDGKQIHFEDFNGQFQGNCDGIISINGEDYILECKSANKKSFEAIKEEGISAVYPVYYCQVQCYMGYAGLDKTLFAVMCKDNSEIYTEVVYFNVDDFVSLKDRAYTIINANQPPKRISNSPNSAVCKYCNYRLVCWYPYDILITPVCKNCAHWQIKDCVGSCTKKPCGWERIKEEIC